MQREHEAFTNNHTTRHDSHSTTSWRSKTASEWGQKSSRVLSVFAGGWKQTEQHAVSWRSESFWCQIISLGRILN